jgi:hypothetical protein
MNGIEQKIYDYLSNNNNKKIEEIIKDLKFTSKSFILKKLDKMIKDNKIKLENKSYTII